MHDPQTLTCGRVRERLVPWHTAVSVEHAIPAKRAQSDENPTRDPPNSICGEPPRHSAGMKLARAQASPRKPR